MARQSYKYTGVKYLGGLPSLPRKTTCTMLIDRRGIALRKWGSVRATIVLPAISSLRVVRYIELFTPTQQDKSVAGRAVVGGLLFGPVGAIVGGMSGIGKKEEYHDMNPFINRDAVVLVVECEEQGLTARCGFIFNNIFRTRTYTEKAMKRIHALRASSGAAPLRMPSMEPGSAAWRMSDESASTARTTPTDAGLRERLKMVEELYRSGSITLVEYEDQRARILESI